MKLAWATDIHLDHAKNTVQHRFYQSVKEQADALVLTGDIAESPSIGRVRGTSGVGRQRGRAPAGSGTSGVGHPSGAPAGSGTSGVRLEIYINFGWSSGGARFRSVSNSRADVWALDGKPALVSFFGRAIHELKDELTDGHSLHKLHVQARISLSERIMQMHPPVRQVAREVPRGGWPQFPLRGATQPAPPWSLHRRGRRQPAGRRRRPAGQERLALNTLIMPERRWNSSPFTP